MSVFPEGLEPVTDLTAARWVETAIGDWPGTSRQVGDVVPPIFDAYARILHQIRPRNEQERSMRWASRAQELGRDLGPETSWWEVIGTAPYGNQAGERQPEIGSLTEDEVKKLVTLLDRSQGLGACWFGLWSGWGFLSPGGHGELRRKQSWFSEVRERRRASSDKRRFEEQLPPQMTVLGDPLLVIAGSVGDSLRFTFLGGYQSPTVWWPEDRSWFVHTNFDAMCTFVGGPSDAIRRLVKEQVLESFEIGVADRAVL